MEPQLYTQVFYYASIVMSLCNCVLSFVSLCYCVRFAWWWWL